METLLIPTDYELERGKPMPSLNHSVVQANLIGELRVRYRQAYTLVSEIDLVMPEKPNAVPDIAIYPKLTLNFLDDTLGMTTMPLTAIEIVSPTQADQDLIRKINRYFAVGVKSCWLVLPGFQAISVYSQVGVYQFFTATDVLTDAATGIELPLNNIFEA